MTDKKNIEIQNTTQAEEDRARIACPTGFLVFNLPNPKYITKKVAIILPLSALKNIDSHTGK